METIERSVRVTTPASPARMILRGAAKRCASCGQGRLCAGWFRMAPTCPRCDYRFEREEGFFLGAYVMNLVIAQLLVVLLAIVPAIALLAGDPDAGLLPVFAGGVVGAVLAPLVFYPFSKTLWVAMELIMRPADAVEPADARE
ncbi:MAG TPA: DUF983 domain-containing protein [Acidimicrobiales bacterium]|nr:DUF983 domain-containing protein [Acidimicrobiales bacterium]